MYGLKGHSEEQNKIVKRLRRNIIKTQKLKGAGKMVRQRGLNCVQHLSTEALKEIVTGDMEVERGKTVAGIGNVACRAGEVKLKTAVYNDLEKKRKEIQKQNKRSHGSWKK